MKVVPLSVLSGAGKGVSLEQLQSFARSGNCGSPNLRHLRENRFRKATCFPFIYSLQNIFNETDVNNFFV